MYGSLLLQFCLTYYHYPAILPVFATNLWSGGRGNISWRETQTPLSPKTCSTSVWGTPRHSQVRKHTKSLQWILGLCQVFLPAFHLILVEKHGCIFKGNKILKHFSIVFKCKSRSSPSHFRDCLSVCLSGLFLYLLFHAGSLEKWEYSNWNENLDGPYQSLHSSNHTFIQFLPLIWGWALNAADPERKPYAHDIPPLLLGIQGVHRA